MTADKEDVAHAQWYETKSLQYFEGVRKDMLEIMSSHGGNATILEIGCGNGAMGEVALASSIASRYYGVELFEGAASEAEKRLTGVVCGDVESINLPWGDVEYDFIVASEVLEHLIDPWKVVNRLANALSPGGAFLASSPNISHYAIVKRLALGRFDLEDSGPMDRTHLRWFTPDTFAMLFETAGLEVESLGPVSEPGPKARLLMKILPRNMRGRLWRQLNVQARKPAS